MKSVIKILFVLLLIGCNSNQSIPDNFDAIVIGVKDGVMYQKCVFGKLIR